MSKAEHFREGFLSITVRRFPLVASVMCAFILVMPNLFAEDGETNAPAVSTEETNSLETLRTYLQLQEQLHATQLAIEQGRKESERVASEAARILGDRLQAVESALTQQRARDLEAMQSSNRVMLTVAGSFAGVGIIAMALMAYLQYRSMDRLAQLSMSPAFRALPAPLLASLETGENRSPEGAAEQSSARLLAVLDRLEHRIADLERSSRRSLENGAPVKATADKVEDRGREETGAEVGNGQTPELSGLLVKGQGLLDQDEPEEALACFETVLRSDKANTEALVKKGAALERLGQLNQAIECYNQAIAVDDSMTIAYLHKGGLCNRLERFSEALACYEQALRTQESRG